jgi:hypothetical protein
LRPRGSEARDNVHLEVTTDEELARHIEGLYGGLKGERRDLRDVDSYGRGRRDLRPEGK